MKPWYYSKVVKHAAFWLIWFCVGAVLFAGGTKKLTGAGWWCFDADAWLLLLVYYASFFVLCRLWNRFDHKKYGLLRPFGRVVYLLKVETLVVLGLMAAYTLLTLWMYRMPGYRYPTSLLTHIGERVERVIPYVLVAGMQSFAAPQVERVKLLVRAVKRRKEKVERYSRKPWELYRKGDDERNLN